MADLADMRAEDYAWIPGSNPWTLSTQHADAAEEYVREGILGHHKEGYGKMYNSVLGAWSVARDGGLGFKGTLPVRTKAEQTYLRLRETKLERHQRISGDYY